jgi:hypothetical protein
MLPNMMGSLNQFVLVKARKSRGGDHWSPDDYDVRNSHGKAVGRIMHHPQAPKDQPWFWTITAREIPPSVHNHGYSATREQAMADFKTLGGDHGLKKQRPRRRCSGPCLFWLKRGDLIRSAFAKPPESVVQAHQNSLNIGLSAEDVVSANVRTAGKVRVSLKAQEIVFEEHGPLRHELPFHTTASRPAGATVPRTEISLPKASKTLARTFAHAAPPCA